MSDYVVPDVIGEVIAFRAWIASYDDELDLPVLLSLNGEEWPPHDWMVAECSRRCEPEELPGVRCSCGIYAATDPKHLAKLRYNREKNAVVGEVALAGRIIPGTRGWRAARARIVRLWVPYDKWELANDLVQEYRVPVHLANTLRAIKREELSGHRD